MKLCQEIKDTSQLTSKKMENSQMRLCQEIKEISQSFV